MIAILFLAVGTVCIGLNTQKNSEERFKYANEERRRFIGKNYSEYAGDDIICGSTDRRYCTRSIRRTEDK